MPQSTTFYISLSPSGGPSRTPSPSKAGSSSSHAVPGVRKEALFKRDYSAAKTARKLAASKEEEDIEGIDVPQILKVDGKPFDKTAYYESLLLPSDFGSPPPLSPSPFSPLPPHPHNVACLFDEDENGELHLDYTAMVNMFYPLVHPDCDEFTLDLATGLRTIQHSFCNMAILPDFIVENPAACRLLDLCP